MQDDYFASLVAAARVRADKAIRKFPQPNYVLNKVAEESGEVIKAVIHYTEGREEWANVEGELVDNLAMLIRLITEGDQVIGFTPPDAYRATMLQAVNHTEQHLGMVDSGWIPVSERMPEDRESVLLWDIDLDDACSGHYSHQTGNFYQAGMIIDNEITHWMPLPAAPQQEE
ncbi:DUF551 domain-containing protein [Citrobacter freundii]|uniref:DUF551 domain-containing protein n=1 Tax=Citrobacter freundii TaxID=546 RepID=UPI0015F1AE64|nr:DUF551 domain-containing protein [Citrobacter freundii]